MHQIRRNFAFKATTSIKAGRTMPRVVVAGLLLLGLTLPSFALANNEQRKEKLERALSSRGIETTQAGLKSYLESIHPTEAQTQRAESLIKRLGDADFAERETATQDLFRMPTLPTDLLRQAAQSDDPEVSWRAKTLLKEGKKEFESTLSNVFRYIEVSQQPGLLSEINAALNLIQSDATRRLALESFVASASVQDVPMLLEQAKSKDFEFRLTAVRAIARVDSQGQEAWLLDVVNKDDEKSEIRMAAIEGLANLGRRETLKPLVQFLQDDEVIIRSKASFMLRQLTGETFQYAAYDKQERRDASVARWQDWLAAKGSSVELSFPLGKRNKSTTNLYGTTLLALGYSNKTIELDAEGNEILSLATPGAWMAERMANGNTLVAEYNANQLCEYNPSGERVWQVAMPSILSARPLLNGNVLVSQHATSLVKEIDREGNTVWEHPTGSSCCDAIELENGNIMFAAGNKVVEITRGKDEVWSYDGNQIYGINVCENGNILIAELNGRVIELNRSTKEVIWEHKCNNPVDAMRLPNGNTLITCNDKFIEVTPENEVIWTRTGCNYGSIRR